MKTIIAALIISASILGAAYMIVHEEQRKEAAAQSDKNQRLIQEAIRVKEEQDARAARAQEELDLLNRERP